MRDTFTIVKSLAIGIKEYFDVKIIPSIIIPGFGFLFGMDSQKVLLGLLVLIGIDFITGIFAAKKSGEPIQSRKAVKSAYKVAIYGLLMSAGHITETMIPFNTFIEQAVMTFLALTELISIIENAGKMGFAVPQRLLNQLSEWRDGSSTGSIEDRRVGLPTRREEEIVVPLATLDHDEPVISNNQ